MSRKESKSTAYAVALCLRGVPIRLAADACEVSVSTVTRAMRRRGIEKRPAGRPFGAKSAKKTELTQANVSAKGLAMRELHDKNMRAMFDAVWDIKIPPLTIPTLPKSSG